MGWGYGRVWRPADRFAPWRPVELFREHAPGLDAFQLAIGIGPLAELRAVVLPASRVEDLVALARLEAHVGGFDIAATIGDDRHRALFGAGARAEAGPVLFWSEAIYHLDPSGTDHASAVLGLSAQLPWAITAGLEFAYDGSGSGSPRGYPALWQSGEWADARRVSVGRWYGTLFVEFRPHPRFDFHGRAVVQLEDRSALIQFGVGATASDEAWVGLSAVVGVGAGADGGSPRSEFGVAPYSYTLDVRLFF